MTTSAAAPRATASGAKSWPSRVKPGTQKNSDPGLDEAVVERQAGDLDVRGPFAEQLAKVHAAGVYERLRIAAGRGRATVAVAARAMAPCPGRQPGADEDQHQAADGRGRDRLVEEQRAVDEREPGAR